MKKTILEVFKNGTVEEFEKIVKELDDISPKLQLTFTIEKLKYEQFKLLNSNVADLYNLLYEEFNMVK